MTPMILDFSKNLFKKIVSPLQPLQILQALFLFYLWALSVLENKRALFEIASQNNVDSGKIN